MFLVKLFVLLAAWSVRFLFQEREEPSSPAPARPAPPPPAPPPRPRPRVETGPSPPLPRPRVVDAPKAQFVGDGWVASRSADAACQVCGAGLQEDVVACPSCATLHHAECWGFAGGCSTYGCTVKS